jgi:CRP-like cAMP-binding protein
MLKNQQPQERYPAGHVIFEKGQERGVAYVVSQGVVEIFSGDTVLNEIGEGEIFGEMALIDKGPRSAGARAKTDVLLVPLDEKRFLFLVQQTPFFAIQMMQLLVERLRQRLERAA